MKRFQFRLQPVLKYRQYLERLASRETARAQLDVTLSARRIDEFRREQARVANELDLESVTGISSRLFRSYQDYLELLEKDIEAEIRHKKELELILVEKRRNLKQKSIEKKVMERLRQKREDAYMDEFRKTEQSIMDEMASLKKAREKVDEITR